MGHLWLQVLPVDQPPHTPDPRLLLEQAWMENNLRKDPRNGIALFNLAGAYMGEGDYQRAIARYQRDLAVNPNEPRTLTALGVAFERVGDWEQAKRKL